MAAGARIRGIRKLHSKLYNFGESRSVVTSANFTSGGLYNNEEFGFVSQDAAVVAECWRYFEQLWEAGAEDLTASKLEEWQAILEQARTPGEDDPVPKLPDFGRPAFLRSNQLENSSPVAGAFVKFFGSGTNRADRGMPTIEEISRSGSHWACSYPRRPRQIVEGDKIFMARMVHSPNDYLVYGEAIGREHRDDLDVASPRDLERRPWKKDWPYYIRVTRPKFMNGPLSNGVSLNELMNEMGSNAFLPTARNAHLREGNMVPSRSLMQKPAIQLTATASEWLLDKMNAVYEKHGMIDLADSRLDWPR